MKRFFRLFVLLFLFFPCYQVYAVEFNITSDYVIMYNLNDDNVLYEQDSDKRTNIASLTKIMTTIVAIENVKDLDHEVMISRDVFRGIEDYTVVGFSVGSKVTVRDLLYGVMLPSGADAVNALALEISGSIDGFVGLMNDKVKELGLLNTHFDNPIGMDSDENYSTAYDIAQILKYALKNDVFYEIFKARNYVIPSLNKEITSTLIGYSKSYGLDISDIVGAKSGFTDGAGLCLASVADIDDVLYLLVTIHADTSNRSNAVRDSLEIYDYYSSNYSYQKVIKNGYKFKTLDVKWGKVKSYDVVSKDDVSIYLANDVRKNRIKYVYDGVDFLDYKNKKGDRLGVVKVMYEDSVLTTYDVYLLDEIEYYHPVLYAVIIVSFVFCMLSIEVLIGRKKRKKKKRKK